MSESLTTIERTKKYYPFAVAALSTLALTGCATAADVAATATPFERVNLDYGKSGTITVDDFDSSYCLLGTPFLEIDSTTASYNSLADVLSLTALNGVTLNLTNFDQYTHTVSPADEASQAIFDSYGCEVTAYEPEQ